MSANRGERSDGTCRPKGLAAPSHTVPARGDAPIFNRARQKEPRSARFASSARRPTTHPLSVADRARLQETYVPSLFFHFSKEADHPEQNRISA
eukprot:10675152-Alexandrium_andersonii.AAC.1